MLSTSLFLVTSCSKDEGTNSINEEIVFPNLVGTWEWVQTTGGINNFLDNPEISETTRDIIITPTHFEFFVDGEPLANREYIFTLEESIVTGEEEFVVTFLDDNFRDVVQKDGDVIIFTDDCVACFISVYKLKN